jgi:prefoldin alpha subunit
MDEKLVSEIQENSEKSEYIEEQLKIIEQQILELNSFSKAVEIIGESEEKEILAPVGKGVFIKSDIKDKRLFVDVGSGVFVKKDIGETKKISEEQINKLNNLKMQLLSEVEVFNEKLKGLVEKFEENNK